MAKDLTPEQIASALQAMGMPIPEELQEKVENAVSDAAFHYISERLVNVEDKEITDRATEWQTELFDLAANVHSYIRADEKNRGQGRRMVHFLSFETPDGTFKVELSREL